MSSTTAAVKPMKTPRAKKVDLEKSTSLWADTVKRFFRHKLAVAGLVFIVIVTMASILAPFIAPFDPGLIDSYNRFAPPKGAHILGTDELGHDVFSRLLFGGRISLSVAALTVLCEMLIGILLGSLAGYYGGWVDNLIMRLTDVFFSLPTLLMMLILAIFLGPGMKTIIIVIAILSWMTPARLIRGSFLSLRNMEFAEAARSIGARPGRIMWKHLVPNALAPVIVQGTLDVAGVILTESVLSFLGYGIQPPASSWGTMLSGAQSYMINAPWLAFYPGLMILLTVLAVNFVGDGIRDALDPKLKQ